MQLTCEWHTAIILNCIYTRIMALIVLGFQALYMAHEYLAVLKYWFNFADCAFWYKPTT